jgi:hypothetical protein
MRGGENSGSNGTNHSDNSTALGYKAGYALNDGDNNVFVGYQAGDAVTTGDDNIIIGSDAAASAVGGTNQIVIGKGAAGSADNTVTLGNSSITGWFPGDADTVDLGSATNQFDVVYANKLGFGSTAMTLPTADGAANKILTTNGSGVLSWVNNTTGASLGALSDAITFNNGSMLIWPGNGPSTGTLDNANNNIGLGGIVFQELTSGDDNIAIGAYGLQKNTDGTGNVAIGYYAMRLNTSGHYNTAVGYTTLDENTTGLYNTALGRGAMSKNTEGDRNVAVGMGALEDNLTSDYNTAVGNYSLSNVTGESNTALGHQAGDLIITGTQNVIIGKNSDPSANDASNQIVIGYGATGTGNDEIALGNTSISAIKGQVSFTTYSDRRIKREINNSKLGLDFIMKLRPVTYKMKNPADYPDEILEDRLRRDSSSGPNDDGIDPRPADDETIYDGLIAQEVKKVIDEARINWSGWSKNESDGKQGIQYGALTIPLIKAVQEQQETIDFQNKEIESLNKRLEKIEKMLNVGK